MTLLHLKLMLFAKIAITLKFSRKIYYTNSLITVSNLSLRQFEKNILNEIIRNMASRFGNSCSENFKALSRRL